MTTPQGELLFHIFGALAQFERSLIQERVHAGLAAARRRGRRGGRPVALDGGATKAGSVPDVWRPAQHPDQLAGQDLLVSRPQRARRHE